MKYRNQTSYYNQNNIPALDTPVIGLYPNFVTQAKRLGPHSSKAVFMLLDCVMNLLSFNGI